jgi:LacI family transcriptional regulator
MSEADLSDEVGRSPGRVTMKDIAKIAGVSHGTLSKALRSSHEVSAETTRRVIEIAARLGFRPNNIARTFRGQRSNIVGVITNEGDGLFTTAMIRDVTEVAAERGPGVFICNNDGETEKERRHGELLLDKQVDGIIRVPSRLVRRESA